MSIRKRFMQMRVETGFPLNYPKLLLHSHTNTDELHTGVADDASPMYEVNYIIAIDPRVSS